MCDHPQRKRYGYSEDCKACYERERLKRNPVSHAKRLKTSLNWYYNNRERALAKRKERYLKEKVTQAELDKLRIQRVFGGTE